MFSEVPDGTVKHALGSTTTIRATRGAISGEPYRASVVFHWFFRDHVREHPRVDHPARTRPVCRDLSRVSSY
jgi:hypothetical protein